MADTLLIRLATAGDGFRDWMLVDESGAGRTPVREGAPEAGVVAGAARILVIVPGDDVLLSEARVPGRNRQRVLRAIPYALEEQLAADVETLHFAIGPMQEDDRYPVAVVDRARMEAWSALLSEHRIAAHQWVPETLALPFTEDGWSLMVEGGRVLVRSGAWAGFVSDLETFASLLALFVSRGEAPSVARLYGGGSLEVEGLAIETVEPLLNGLEVLGRGVVQGPLLDLLQGPYSRSEEWGRILRPWKATAALLAAGLVLTGASTALDYYRLGQRQAQLEAEIVQVYRDTFPQARRIVNPRAQMEQQLRQLQRQAGAGGKAGFLAMLADVGKILRNSKGIRINGATFRDGRLDLELLADNVQLLDQLKQTLGSEAGLRAEIQSATTRKDGKVSSRLRIEGGRA